MSSNGDEDCFVVARNYRSATKVEVDYCGFDPGDIIATRVKAIEPQTIQRWIQRRRIGRKSFNLPWYADHWLLKELGAQFRERDDISETLIDDVVYTTGTDEPVLPRTIGRKYINEFREVRVFQRYGHEDRYSDAQMTLFSLLGICVARCQEIERLIAHSFILAAMSPKERKRNRTIRETIESWERKTLGQMIRSIEEGYDIDPILHQSMQLFLSMRNKLIHDLTTSNQYNIETSWGQGEMIGFLMLFELITRPLREAFKASLFASIDIGNSTFLADSPEKQLALTKRQKKKISLFTTFFSPKEIGKEKSST